MAGSGRKRRLCVAYLALAALALGNAGCLVAAAAGAAAGGAGAYAYYKGRVCRTYVANVEDVRAATHKALAELQLPVIKNEPTARGGTIETKSGEDTITITLELQDSRAPGEGPGTQVGVRVGNFGNEGLSQRILDQIAFHLVPVNPLPPGPPQLTSAPPLTPVAASGPPPTAQTAPPPLAK
jgi:hypothetical protein